MKLIVKFKKGTSTESKTRILKLAHRAIGPAAKGLAINAEAGTVELPSMADIGERGVHAIERNLDESPEVTRYSLEMPNGRSLVDGDGDVAED